MERKEFKRKEEGTEVRRWVDEIGGRGGWKPPLLPGGFFWSPAEEERADQKRKRTH